MGKESNDQEIIAIQKIINGLFEEGVKRDPKKGKHGTISWHFRTIQLFPRFYRVGVSIFIYDKHFAALCHKEWTNQATIS